MTLRHEQHIRSIALLPSQEEKSQTMVFPNAQFCQPSTILHNTVNQKTFFSKLASGMRTPGHPFSQESMQERQRNTLSKAHDRRMSQINVKGGEALRCQLQESEDRPGREDDSRRRRTKTANVRPNTLPKPRRGQLLRFQISCCF